jgi:subtilisin family serine protease
MAAPHAAGTAALILAAHPGMPPLAVIARMQNTALPIIARRTTSGAPDPEAVSGRRRTSTAMD